MLARLRKPLPRCPGIVGVLAVPLAARMRPVPSCCGTARDDQCGPMGQPLLIRIGPFAESMVPPMLLRGESLEVLQLVVIGIAIDVMDMHAWRDRSMSGFPHLLVKSAHPCLTLDTARDKVLAVTRPTRVGVAPVDHSLKDHLFHHDGLDAAMNLHASIVHRRISRCKSPAATQPCPSTQNG